MRLQFVNRFTAFIFSAICLMANGTETTLFVGNSYLYYNDSVHNHVEDLLREFYEDNDIHTELIAIGGSRLHHHSIEQILNYQIFGLDEPVDRIIFQGGSSEVKTPKNREILAKTSTEYSQKAQEMGIKTYLYMTHPYQKSDHRYEENLIEKIKLAYYQAGKKSNSIVIPVGIAFEIAYEKNPSIRLHLPDGTHPNMLGTYLASSTVFATLTGASPVGLEYNYMGRVNDSDKAFLQNIAWLAYIQNKKNLKSE